MKIIVCLDDGLGMTFNGRRQSRDRRVIDDILSMTDGARLYISPFSEKLFSECGRELTVDADMMKKACDGEYCFVENIAVEPYISRAHELIIYRWNRRYPSDMRFCVDIENEGFSLVSSADFEGYSHEKITKEIYRR